MLTLLNSLSSGGEDLDLELTSYSEGSSRWTEKKDGPWEVLWRSLEPQRASRYRSFLVLTTLSWSQDQDGNKHQGGRKSWPEV